MALIKQHSIEELIDKADLVKIVAEYTDLQKKGANYQGKCPNHDEKTASFVVSESKNLAKCFGCELSAVGPVNFLMQVEKISWYDALLLLAKKENFTFDYEEVDEEVELEVKQKQKAKASSYKILQSALNKYLAELDGLKQNHKAWKELSEKRQLSKETIQDFQIGYAPENMKFITNMVNEKGIFEDALKAGIVAQNEKGTKYDAFINRIIFPIYNSKNKLVAFGGQNLNEEVDENGKYKYVKYKNGSDTHIFSKKHTLFGLHLAAKAIRTEGFAIITEGYYDVISAHEKTLNNTVGTCGTSFTIEHGEILKKHTNKLLFVFDGDPAGKKALVRALKIALLQDFYVECVILENGMDLDDFCRQNQASQIHQLLINMKEDALHWYTNFLTENAKDVQDKENAVEVLAGIVATIKSPIKKNNYVKSIAKHLGSDVPIATFKTMVKDSLEQTITKKLDVNTAEESDLPAHVNKDEWYKFGFYEETEKYKAGYYFHKGNGVHENVSNFIVKPLFHIYGSDNKRLIELNNGLEQKIIEMPSKALISLEQFSSTVFDEGYYLFTGTKHHLLKVLGKIADKFPLCYELKVLGWQKEGFFTYSNAVVKNGEMEYMDDYGIATFEEKNYFSPSVSKVYADMRADDDEFENDRFLVFKDTPISFSKWTSLMSKVYPDHYIYGLGFIFISLFKDLVYKIDNNCPHLSCYGQKGSGKSKFAESLSAFFFQDMQPFNLNHGTDFAFASRLSRFRNCIGWFDEFDDGAIKEERFQSIKAAYDGAGRERGKGGKRNRTEIMHVNAALVLTGQYLSTRDDNAALTRCVLLDFKPVSNANRTSESLANYTKLKELEKEGAITGLLPQVLKYRKEIEKDYQGLFATQFAALREAIAAQKGNYKDRILRNYCAIATMLQFFSKKLELNIDLELAKQKIAKDIISLSNLIDESDALGGFWIILQNLYESRILNDGFHFRIISTNEVTIQEGRQPKEIKTFPTVKNLLFLRVQNVHGMYAEAASKQKSGIINLQSLKLYMESSAAFIGKSPGYKFSLPNGKSTTTTSYVFDYDKLGIELQTLVGDSEIESSQTSQKNEATDQLPF